MKPQVLRTLLLLAANASCHAAVPLIGDYATDTRAARPPWFILDNDNLQNDDGTLDRPSCRDGLIQTPPPITDLHTFFAGHPVSQAADRGGRYARLNFGSPPTDITPVRAAYVWFDSSRLLTSTCLARVRQRTGRGVS